METEAHWHRHWYKLDRQQTHKKRMSEKVFHFEKLTKFTAAQITKMANHTKLCCNTTKTSLSGIPGQQQVVCCSMLTLKCVAEYIVLFIWSVHLVSHFDQLLYYVHIHHFQRLCDDKFIYLNCLYSIFLYAIFDLFHHFTIVRFVFKWKCSNCWPCLFSNALHENISSNARWYSFEGLYIPVFY